LLAVFSLSLPGYLVAQEGDASTSAEASENAPYTATVAVNVVNVEVYVTDKEGRPVEGLTRDDFVILEDKVPVEISNFYAAKEETRVENRDRVPLRAELPGEIEQRTSPSEPEFREDQRLYLVVFVDNFNIHPFNRNRVFRRLREFLTETIQSDDRVMLVSYDRSIHIRHPFTSRPELISAALFELESMTGHAVQRSSERQSAMEAVLQAEEPHQAEWEVASFADSAYNDLKFTIEALRNFVDSLAGLPGRKMLLHVSDGIEMIPGQELYHALQNKFPNSNYISDSLNQDATRDFQRLAARANEHRVSFYTIDAAGLRVSSSISAEVASADSRIGSGTMLDSILFHNLQSSLVYLANATGGQAIINQNDVIKGLRKFRSDFRTYYSLGYQAPRPGNSRYHKIEVKLAKKMKGVRIRHREGYRDKPVSTQMTDGTMSTLQYGFQQNPLNLGISFEPSAIDEQGFHDVPMVIEIPIGNVVLIPREAIYRGQAQIYFAAMDFEERQSLVQTRPVTIEIPADEIDYARTQNYHYRVILKLRPGEHRIAIGVRDEIGATKSFVSRTVNIGA
ncbi:MAG: VWA domain-containing protein, partial [Rhodothermales bacterium]|nr:VWA domain-containing protein [Rhodothermales bacterium]